MAEIGVKAEHSCTWLVMAGMAVMACWPAGSVMAVIGLIWMELAGHGWNRCECLEMAGCVLNGWKWLEMAVVA